MGVVESLTGTRAVTCPWAAFHNPLVIATLRAYPFFESGQLEFATGGDAPAVLVEALECYHTALARVGDAQRREREREREQNAKHSTAVREMGSIYGRR